MFVDHFRCFLCGPKDRCLQRERQVVLKNFAFLFKTIFATKSPCKRIFLEQLNRGGPPHVCERNHVFLLAGNTTYIRDVLNMKLWEDDDYYLGLHFQVPKPLVLGREHIVCCTLGMQKTDSDILTSQRLSFPNFNPASFRQMIQFHQIWLEVFFGGVDPIWSQLQLSFWIIRSFFEGDGWTHHPNISQSYPSLALGLRILLEGFLPSFLLQLRILQLLQPYKSKISHGSFWASKCRLRHPKVASVAIYGSKILLTKPV